MTELTFTAVAGCPHLGHLAYLKKWLPKAVKLVRRAPREVSVALLGDTKMAALHERFMGLPGTTDVLTFELEHEARKRRGARPKPRAKAGEVVVCVPYARREAKRRGTSADAEVLLYALHGILHLSGHDDLTPAAHARMHAEEDRILKTIGVGAVFDAAAQTAPRRRRRRTSRG